MEEAIRARLLATAAVTAICSTRINWGSHPQGHALPGIVLQRISGAEGATLQGRDGLDVGRVQVDAWALDYGAAKTLARAVVASLHGHRTAPFQGVFHEATREEREGGSNEADRPYRVSLDFIVNWRAT